MIEGTRGNVVKEMDNIDRNRKILQTMYYILGFVTVMLSIIITSFSTREIDVVFWMSLAVSILTTALNFFKIESKINSLEHNYHQFHSLLCEIQGIQIKGEYSPDIERSVTEKLVLLQNNQQRYCF